MKLAFSRREAIALAVAVGVFGGAQLAYAAETTLLNRGDADRPGRALVLGGAVLTGAGRGDPHPRPVPSPHEGWGEGEASQRSPNGLACMAPRTVFSLSCGEHSSMKRYT
jgi:hypothetical protein